MNQNKRFNKHQSPIITGAILLVIGLVWFLNQLGFYLPKWLFRWELIPIVVGIIIGSKQKFGPPYGWPIPIIIGVLFIITNEWDFDLWRFIIPIGLITAGIIIIMNAANNKKNNALLDEHSTSNPIITETYTTEDSQTTNTNAYNSHQANTDYTTNNNYVESISIFGGSKKVVNTNNFRGGEITSIFGGTEINLMNAELQSPAVIDITQIMGGTSLIIPNHWEVRNQVFVLMGGVDDKRRNTIPSSNKVLILKGTTIMGGIDIKSI